MLKTCLDLFFKIDKIVIRSRKRMHAAFRCLKINFKAILISMQPKKEGRGKSFIEILSFA